MKKKVFLLAVLLVANLAFVEAQSTTAKPATKKERAEQKKAEEAAKKAAKEQAKAEAKASGNQAPKSKASRRGRVNKWINTADEAFSQERYHKAYGYYERAFGRAPEGAVRNQLRWKLGETQRRLNHSFDAVIYFDRVWQSGNRDKEFLTSYGDALLKTANYEKADTVYRILLRLDTSDVLIKNRLQSCEIGRNYKDSLNIILEDEIMRQTRVSSPFSEYGLTIVEGKLILSSSKRVSPRATDYRTSQGFSHLYLATLFPDSTLWEKPTPLSYNIWGDKINDGVFSYDSENKIGYFQRCNGGNCGIYTTVYEEGNWSIPQKFEVNGVGAANVVGQPAVSPDGKRLLFVAKAPEGEGGSDIWMTTKLDKPATTRRTSSRQPTARQNTRVATSARTSKSASKQTEKAKAAPAAQRTTAARNAKPTINNAEWDVPVNLGKYVNTPGDEVFPVWLNENAFAFSSNGHPGYGGLDLFIVYADSTGAFTQLKHVQGPINSSFDDYNFVVSHDLDRMFFSSSRYYGSGYTDEVYSFPKRSSSIEINFEVKDVLSLMPLQDVSISVCKKDSVDCETLITDADGKAQYYSIKSSPQYHITFDKDDYFSGTYTLVGNAALQIIPTQDVEQMHVAMHRDTTVDFIMDSIPVEWNYLAQNLNEDTVEIIAVATIDSLIQLYSEEDACIEGFKMNLTENPNYTVIQSEMKVLPVSEPKYYYDSALNCEVKYYEEEAYFSKHIKTIAEEPFDVQGTISYTIKTPRSEERFDDVPFTTTVKPIKKEVKEEVAEDKPLVSWYYSVEQFEGAEDATLMAKAIIAEGYKLYAPKQVDTVPMPISFFFIPQPTNYLIDLPLSTSHLPLTEQNNYYQVDADYFVDSVLFMQPITLTSDNAFRVNGVMNYTLGGPNDEYKSYYDVPLSFPILGKEEPVLAQAEKIEEEPEEEGEKPYDDSWDESWLDEMFGEEEDKKEVGKVEDIDNKIRVKESTVQDLSECMKPGMSAQEIIDCLNRSKVDEETVDTRTIDNYKDRINDPNRRNNLTKLPASVKCKDCSTTPQRQDASKDLYVEAGDDKKVLKLTDNAGNITYVDLAPNTKYQINVENAVMTADGEAKLPDYLEQSDLVKTVSTKDYVIFECMPKLAEIGDEAYVNNMYYDFDKSDIIKDGYRELDRLIVIALKNPNYRIEIEAHADERGSEEYNTKLTERRLETITEYVEKKGFDLDRLITRAMGKSTPLIKGAVSDEEHAMNRRATIRMIDPNASNKLKNMDYEVKENSPLNKKGLYFRVQIGAYRDAPEYPLFFFKDVLKVAQGYELSYYQDKDGLYKYTIGEFSKPEDARKLNAKILDSGKEAYVVAFMDGQRITVNEAQMILNRMKK